MNRYLGKFRVRVYDLTKTDGKNAKTVGILFWSTYTTGRRKWTLDISLGKTLIAIWRADDWIWGKA